MFALKRKPKLSIPHFDQRSQELPAELPAERQRQEIMDLHPNCAELPIERKFNAGLSEMSAGAYPTAELSNHPHE